MSVFYPSLVVHLRIRFDETMQVQDLRPPQPQDGILGTPLEVGPPSARPLILERGQDRMTHLMNRVPRTASVETPGYRQSGRFTCEFDWRELPIDPRLMRAIGVEIYLGAVNPDDFSTGMIRVEPDGRRVSVLNTLTPEGLPNNDLMVLAGVVDTWVSEHDEGRSIVRMEGRDLRAVFLDSPINPKLLSELDLKQPIHDLILSIINTHPAGKDGKINVVANPDDWPNRRIPECADRDGLTRVRRRGNGEGANTGSSGGSSSSYWDIITKYCTLVGAVPFFKGRDIHVRPARSLFDQTKPNIDPRFSPFAFGPRTVSGQTFSHRKFVYGNNIRSLSFERKYTGTKVPLVEVVSMDTSSKVRGAGKLLIQEWPPKDKELARISGVAPSGESSQSDKIQFSVPGIRSTERMLEIAKNLYEEIGRQEMGGSCRTKSLASFGGDNSEDPDILRLRTGDVVEFLVDTRTISSRAPLVSEFTDHTRRSFEEQVEEIKKAMRGKAGGVDDNLARVLAASSRGAIIAALRFFRTGNVKFNWSSQSGIDVTFDFQNYLVVRSGVTEELGENQQKTVRKTTRRKNLKDPGERVKFKPSRKSSVNIEFGNDDSVFKDLK